MADRDTDDELSDVEHEIMTIYFAIVADHIQTHYLKTPMCTSALPGKSYVQETLDGHPQNCYNTSRRSKHVFLHLCNELKRLHLLEEDTGIVSVRESIGVVLYILGHNADIRLVGNRFQHSLETIKRRFRRALQAIHSLGCLIIRLDQDAAELPHHLRGNTKYYPWFEKCVVAIDGTHISAHAPGCKSTAYRDRCCDIFQNVMCACNFDKRFTYVHVGWEGSAHDSRVMQEAIANPGFQFPWPPRGSYYLVDSGCAIGSAFLPSHKSVRYHAQEFRGSARQLRTPQELFNYRHFSLRMVIERCFGVLNARFPILNDIWPYSQSRQRLIVTACCALHNFIRMYSHADKMFHVWEGQDLEPGDASTSGGARVGGGGNEEAFSPQAQEAISRFRDEITAVMWAEYTGNHS